MRHLVFILIKLYTIAYKICETLEKCVIMLYNYYVNIERLEKYERFNIYGTRTN